MIFNCTNCGISISSKRVNCLYCRTSNAEIIEMMVGRSNGDVPSSSRWGARPHVSINSKEKLQLKERTKGTIFSFVTR